MTNLGDLMEYGVIIAANDEYGAAITWNGSATFCWWTDGGDGTMRNVDVMTVYDVQDLGQAIRIAQEWVEEALSESDED